MACCRGLPPGPSRGDAGFTDDLIGETTIDLEDRWFAEGWKRFGEAGTGEEEAPSGVLHGVQGGCVTGGGAAQPR